MSTHYIGQLARLVTFTKAVWMDGRDRKPDCSGLKSEWETASVDNSSEKCGCLASGRLGWRLLKDGQACQHLWVMGGFCWSGSGCRGRTGLPWRREGWGQASELLRRHFVHWRGRPAGKVQSIMNLPWFHRLGGSLNLP